MIDIQHLRFHADNIVVNIALHVEWGATTSQWMTIRGGERILLRDVCWMRFTVAIVHKALGLQGNLTSNGHVTPGLMLLKPQTIYTIVSSSLA